MKASTQVKTQEITPELQEIIEAKEELFKTLSENLSALSKRMGVLHKSESAIDTDKALTEIKSLKKLITGLNRDCSRYGKMEKQIKTLQKPIKLRPLRSPKTLISNKI